MKSLINIVFFLIALLPSISFSEQKINQLKVIAIYQIEDEEEAGFDFFTAKKTHKCGGKLSNRFRSYSSEELVSERKFQLVLSAMNYGHSLTVSGSDCEGKSLVVDFIGISR